MSQALVSLLLINLCLLSIWINVQHLLVLLNSIVIIVMFCCSFYLFNMTVRPTVTIQTNQNVWFPFSLCV